MTAADPPPCPFAHLVRVDAAKAGYVMFDAKRACQVCGLWSCPAAPKKEG